MESNLFIELAEEQQEVVAGGVSLSASDYASYLKQSASILQGASAGPEGATSFGVATADYTSTYASRFTNINPYFYY